MTDFGALVRAGLVPCFEGLFGVDGAVRRVDYDGPHLSWFEMGALFVPDRRCDPDDVADVDWADGVALPNGEGSVCCGEGSMGADGFFARLDPGGVPVWVAFMRNSNLFLRARVDGRVATFINNLGRSVVIDLERPEFAA